MVEDQSILPLVINLVILITFTLDDLLMLLGENLCLSLLGPKRLKKNVPRRDGRIRRLAKFEMSAFESFFFFSVIH